MIISQNFGRITVLFHFQASSTPRIKSSTFLRLWFFPHKTPFRRKYVEWTGMLTFGCCTIWTLARQAVAQMSIRQLRKPAVLKETVVPFVHYKSHIEYPGIETGSQQWEVGFGWPELTQPTSCITLTIVKQNCLQNIVSHTVQSYSFSKKFSRFSLRFCCRQSLIKVSYVFNVVHFPCHYIAYTKVNTN